MQAFPVPVLPSHPVLRPRAGARARTALVASADRSFRQRLAQVLSGLRWQVREAEGGAQAWAEARTERPEAMIVDAWLPDLVMGEFLREFRESFPDIDLITTEGSGAQGSPRGPHHQELLYALRQSQETDTAAWNAASALAPPSTTSAAPKKAAQPASGRRPASATAFDGSAIAPDSDPASAVLVPRRATLQHRAAGELRETERLPELVGNAAVHARDQPPRAAGGAANDAGPD